MTGFRVNWPFIVSFWFCFTFASPGGVYVWVNFALNKRTTKASYCKVNSPFEKMFLLFRQGHKWNVMKFRSRSVKDNKRFREPSGNLKFFTPSKVISRDSFHIKLCLVWYTLLKNIPLHSQFPNCRFPHYRKKEEKGSLGIGRGKPSFGLIGNRLRFQSMLSLFTGRIFYIKKFFLSPYCLFCVSSHTTNDCIPTCLCISSAETRYYYSDKLLIVHGRSGFYIEWINLFAQISSYIIPCVVEIDGLFFTF